MKLLKLLILTTLLVALVSCQTFDPYTGERKTNNASKYGLGAAIVCGLIGAGESGKHARNAAAGCGAIGATIGAYTHNHSRCRFQWDLKWL